MKQPVQKFKSVSLTLVSCLILSVAVSAPSIASADQRAQKKSKNEMATFVVPASQSEIALTSDEESDIALIISQERRQLEEDDSLVWQTQFTVAVTRLQEEFSDQFSDAGIDPENNAAWVSFAKKAPAEIGEILSNIPVDVEVRENVGWTESEIAEYGAEVHFAILSQAGVNDADTDIDTRLGRVTTTVEAHSRTDSAALNERLQRALPTLTSSVRAKLAHGNDGRLSGLKASESRIVTAVVVVEELNSGNETVSSGGSLRTCTAGFSAKVGNYAHGIITAQHCNKSQNYFGRSVLTWRSSHAGNSGDVAFFSSTEASDARFYHKSGATRPLNATANPVVGMSICQFGKTTQLTCDEVYKLNQCRGQYCGQAMVHRHRTSGGDSGGPWFVGNTGYGVHSGYKTHLLIERSMFTPVRKGASALGLTIKLS